VTLKKLFAILVLLTATTFSFAQDASSMAGTVTDATGAVIPGVLVTLTNKLKGTTYKQVTDKSGSYRFQGVPPTDGYTAAFSKNGFSVLRIDNITLNVGVTRTQEAKLLAGASEVVEISASSQNVTLDTTDASIGNNVDVARLNQLPVYDRTAGVSTLFNLQPGVDNTQLGGSGSVTGARTDQTSVTVDGLDVNDIAAGSAFAVIGTAPIDSIEQFTGTVAGLVPSLGTGAGGQFQLVTKSGTNKFHGNLNEYHRDTSTVANTYFNNLDGLPRTPLIRNQFGGNIGGPILKDKLFFFFDFADSRIIQSGTTEQVVPMANLVSATPTLNYINSGAGCGASSRLNTTPTCISTLSAAQVAAFDPGGVNPAGAPVAGFDPSVLSYLAGRYPKPNDLTQGDGVNTAGYRFSFPDPTFETTYVTRVDYNLTSTQKIYGRFTINRTNEVYTGPQFKGDPDSTTEQDNSYGYVVSDIWTIGKNKVNQFYYGDNISKLNFPAGDFPTTPNVYSFSGLANPYGTYNSQKRRVPIPVVRDDFNWQVGRHSLTMGGLFKFIKTNSNSVTDYNFVEAGTTGAVSVKSTNQPTDLNPSSAAVAAYNNLFTTSLGVVGEVSTNFNYNTAGQASAAGSGGPRAYRYFETEAYFGDTWKVNRQLTLTYGLRYQVYSVPYEVHGEESVSEEQGLSQRASTFNQYFNERQEQNAIGAYVLPGGASNLPFFQEVLGGKANNGPSSYAPSYKDFAPRLAFAYNPTWSPKTVINGSAAIVYDRTVINAINFLQDQLSFLFFNNQSNTFGLAGSPRLGANLSYLPSATPTPSAIAPGYIPYVSGGSAYGLDEGEEGFVIDPGLKDPYSIDLNFGVQRELPDHIVLKANYAGRLGRRLLADADAAQVLNFPDIVSGQNLSQAFAGITTQLRAGGNPESATGLTAQPWFEDLVGANIGGAGVCTGAGYANCTSLAADYASPFGTRGDIADAIYLLNAYGILPQNVGIPAQFGTQAFLTNKGSSSYSAFLLSLSKNRSHGLQYDFNYTFAHSIDNNSQSANNNALYNVTGIICDVTKPRACRGNSDFDVRQELNGNFVYELPVGHGKMFLGNSSTLVEEALGGWSVSGITSYRTGLSNDPLSYAFLASFAAEDPAIFTGNKSDLKAHINKVGSTIYNFAGGAAGATKVFNEFRGPIGLEYGQRNLVKGPGAFDLDMGLAKIFPIYPAKGVNLNFRADAFNLFNHPNFSNPTLDIVNNAAPFGQVKSTINTAGITAGYRVAQFSLRLEF
jgi:hypothetical protein